ncbi:MAG: riboflavin synthase [Oleiphilaceae bacterium]|jgi:riboflavin synthase
MFTGIIEALGKIQQVSSHGKDLVLSIDTGSLDLSGVKLGDSVAVNGVCLTVISLGDQHFSADVSAESLVHTDMRNYQRGTKVNLEKALTLSTPLGGHLVSGHVDGLGEIIVFYQEGRAWRYEVSCPQPLLKYIANKGSVTIDGVSLTVTGLESNSFMLNIVPHTTSETRIQTYGIGDKVHIEVDLMARYAERLLTFSTEVENNKETLNYSFLAEHGFLR